MSVTVEKLRKAIIVNNITLESIERLLEEWLRLQNLSVEKAKKQYVLHYLQLDHQLKDATNNSGYDGTDTTSPAEELPNILNSLSVVHHLLQTVDMNQSPNSNSTIFKTIADKIEHNRTEVRGMLSQSDYCTSVPNYSYNENHDSVEYGIITEAIRLLAVIRKKYEIMLENVE